MRPLQAVTSDGLGLFIVAREGFEIRRKILRCAVLIWGAAVLESGSFVSAILLNVNTFAIIIRKKSCLPDDVAPDSHCSQAHCPVLSSATSILPDIFAYRHLVGNVWGPDRGLCLSRCRNPAIAMRIYPPITCNSI
jgi:hypothetical protein